MPIKEVTDLPCSEIIKEMLKLTPDAVTWLDYSTIPPTFHVTRRAACGALTLPFAGSPEDIELTPRYDLLRSQVVVRYLQDNKTDGVPSVNVTIDAAPPGADGLAFDALVSTVRLAGGNATYEKQPIKTQPIPTASTDNDTLVRWLQRHQPWLNQFTEAGPGGASTRLLATWESYEVEPDPGARATGGNPGNTDDSPDDYPNELLSGNVTDWMQTGPDAIITGRITVHVSLKYQYPDTPDDESSKAYNIFGPDGGQLANFNNDLEFQVCVRGTNASTKTYTQLSSYDAPEPAPTGFAAILYSALSILHYEGTYTTVSAEAGAATLGTVLNITGSRQPWSTMNALVQEITDDLDAGRTTWHVGPPGYLSIRSLMAMLNYTRHRRPSTHIAERRSGQPSAPSTDGDGIGVHNSGGSPPTPTAYPFIDFTDILDDGDGRPETWSALFGYGKDDTIAGPDAIDHSGPLESFELSVGNDGSGWLDSAGESIPEQASLPNLLSIISGEQNARNDQILIGVSGGISGSIGIYPSGATIHFSPNMNPDSDGDGTPTLDVAYDQVEMDAGDGGSLILDVNSITITDSGGGDLSLDPGLISMNSGSASLTIELTAINSTDGSGDNFAIEADHLFLQMADGSYGLYGAGAIAMADNDSYTFSVEAGALYMSGPEGGNGVNMDVSDLSSASGDASFITITIPPADGGAGPGSSYLILGVELPSS